MADLREFFNHLEAGEPSVDDCGHGMHLCFKNAESLLRDAELLRGIGSPRALSMTILALEEMGKILILCNVAAKRTEESGMWAKIKKKTFSSHKHKQQLFASYGSELLDRISKDGESYYKAEVPSGVVPLLDRFKQWGFYVDFIRDGFQSPQRFSDDNGEWLDWCMAAASERLESLRAMHESEEMSLWVARTAGKLALRLAAAKSPDEIATLFKEVHMTRPRPNKPLQPTAREDARSG